MARFSVVRSMETTLRKWAQLLSGGLTFADNFESYEWEGEIPAGIEKRISHPLQKIPTRFSVLYAENTPMIIRGQTRAATADFFYVKNASSTSTFKGKILILA